MTASARGPALANAGNMVRIAIVVCLVACTTASRPETGAMPDAAPQATPDAAHDASTPRRITVLTVNLKTPLPSDDTVDARTQMVADLIAAEAPDVVALQEVTQSGSLANRAEVLAQATGYAWRWRRTHQLVVGEEGIGVLARGDIAWHDDAELPHVELGVLHRAVLGARVIVDGQPIELFATHLTVAGSTGDRADQAVDALAFARAQHQAGVPAFFAGDLNATPGELAMRVLRGEAAHDSVTGDLVDAWTAANGTAPGFTIPSDAPDRRIDYIYAFPGSGTATECRTVLATPVAGVRASDHLGVICRFE